MYLNEYQLLLHRDWEKKNVNPLIIIIIIIIIIIVIVITMILLMIIITSLYWVLTDIN